MAKFGVPSAGPDPLAYADRRLAGVPTVDTPRDPTVNDTSFPIQTIWRNSATFRECMLVGFTGGEAIWSCFTDANGTVLDFETDDGAPFVIPDGLGTTQILGGVGIDVTGQGPGNTITITNTGEETNFTWQEVAVNTQVVVNNGYIVNDAATITMTLPATAVLGDIMCFLQKGAGIITVAQNAGQTVHTILGDTTTGIGGQLDTIDRWSSFCLICVTDDTDFALERGSHGGLLLT